MNKLKKYQCIRVQTFLLGGVLVLASHSALAANNLHFYGNLMSKTCTPVEQAGTLAEVQFANISHKDLMVRGQSDRVPVVFSPERLPWASAVQRKSYSDRNRRQWATGISGSG